MARIRTNVGGSHQDGADGDKLTVLDQLLDGGIFVPVDLHPPVERPAASVARPLLVLVKGPPGGGKSTLALEICYRATMVKDGDEEARWADGPLSGLYASLESPSSWIIDNARSGYGWDADAQVFEHFADQEKTVDKKSVVVLGNDTFWQPQAGGMRLETLRATNIVDLIQREATKRNPGIVAIDGVNVLPPREHSEMFQLICRRFLAGSDGIRPFLLIVAMDSPLLTEEHARWEFIADIVITMSSGYELDYFLRSIEISKGRYQSHALGRQRVKIRGVHRSPMDGPLMEAIDVSPPPTPKRIEGGVAIFPSVHRALSQIKRRGTGGKDAKETPGYVRTPHEELNAIIAPNAHARGEEGGGLPRGKCTAFLGGRGSLKSHLAYHIALEQQNVGRAVTIVTLRDEIDSIKDTLREVARMENLPKDCPAKIRCVYFWPGYITPEQFYQTISRQVLHQEQKPDFVVLAGLDRIEGRFPLCSREPIFVPLLVSLLNLSGVTSIVTSARADAARGRDGLVGPALLPMADLVLQFEVKDSAEHLQCVTLRAVRVPRGEVGGGVAEARRDRDGAIKIVRTGPQ